MQCITDNQQQSLEVDFEEASSTKEQLARGATLDRIMQHAAVEVDASQS
jgi:hypothetical protein